MGHSAGCSFQRGLAAGQTFVCGDRGEEHRAIKRTFSAKLIRAMAARPHISPALLQLPIMMLWKITPQALIARLESLKDQSALSGAGPPPSKWIRFFERGNPRRGRTTAQPGSRPIHPGQQIALGKVRQYGLGQPGSLRNSPGARSPTASPKGSTASPRNPYSCARYFHPEELEKGPADVATPATNASAPYPTHCAAGSPPPQTAAAP